MSKKDYGFEFDVTGKCIVNIKAESLEEAIELVRGGRYCDVELGEWNMSVPYKIGSLSEEEILEYLLYGDEDEA